MSGITGNGNCLYMDVEPVEAALRLSLFAGWVGMLAGVVSGAVIGLFFHRETWLGGYQSHPRRLLRLGHISFFGLGMLNVLFALTIHAVPNFGPTVLWASRLLVIGAVTMPLVCFLTAWRKPMRHLFPIPVVSIGGAVILLLFNWRWS